MQHCTSNGEIKLCLSTIKVHQLLLSPVNNRFQLLYSFFLMLLLMSKTPSLSVSRSLSFSFLLCLLWVKRCVAADVAVSHSIKWHEMRTGNRATDIWQRAITCDRCWPPVAKYFAPSLSPILLSPPLLSLDVIKLITVHCHKHFISIYFSATF